MMRTRPVLAAFAALTLAAAGVGLQSTASTADGGARVFVPGAVLNDDHTVTLPLHRGRSGKQTVWFVVTEASDSNHAEDWRASVSAKLLNARRTAAVQKVTLTADGTVVFPATVDFSPSRVVRPGPAGFPPDEASPGAVGTDGFARGNRVVYASTEASDPGAAAIEDVTFAPALNAAPFAGGDGTDSTRASLAAFTNGPTGVNNPQRQGLNSALLGQGDPLNVLAWLPQQGRYSPRWYVHLTQWAPGQVTGLSAGRWGPSGFIVNCPIIAQRGPPSHARRTP